MNILTPCSLTGFNIMFPTPRKSNYAPRDRDLLVDATSPKHDSSSIDTLVDLGDGDTRSSRSVDCLPAFEDFTLR